MSEAKDRGQLQQVSLDRFGSDLADPVFTDSNGYVWMVHLIDVTNLPDMLRQRVGAWVDTDTVHLKSGSADDNWVPLCGDGVEQLEARKDLLRDGVIGSQYALRIKARRSVPNRGES